MKRRTLATVTPDDESGGGRPILYAYGRRYLARIAGVSLRTVSRAILAEVDLDDPVEAVAWALESRGHGELAKSVRSALGETEGC